MSARQPSAIRATPDFADAPNQPACRAEGVDPDDFHPQHGAPEATDRAKRICRHCHVRTDCLTWAIATRQQWGIWGGHTTEERNRLARKHGIPTP